MDSIWKQRKLPQGVEPDLCSRIERECDVSSLCAQVMVRRGCTSVESAMAWLDPQWEDLYDPFLLPDMSAAVERLLWAKAQGETLCIYGDYDADGTTGTAILLLYLRSLGMNTLFRIPNRLTEGYGLNTEAIDAIGDAGVTLLITVDNGISALTEAAHCKALGIDLIVTDHHEFQGTLPEAVAVIDAKRPDSVYPYKELCGAGVAFKLIQALDQRLGLNSDLSEYLECAALATVADIVPLKDENRVIVSLGLEMMNQGPCNKGIAALIKVSEVASVNAGNLGYTIAPKINAAGRLGHAEQVLDLYLAETQSEAMIVAETLNAENKKRQAIESAIFEVACEQVKTEALDKEDFIIAMGKDWHSGVIGIVASRLQELWFHPVIVIGLDETGLGKGSCRSVPGVDIFEALSACRHLFSSFGGHEMAAGFSIREERIPELKAALKDWGAAHSVREHCVRTFYYDAFISPEVIDFEILDELNRCEPCGVGNPGPVFKMAVPKAQRLNTLGREQNHLSFEMDGMRYVGFNLAKALPLIRQGKSTILCRLKENRFNGNVTVQPNIIDIKGDPLKDNQQCWAWIEALQKGQMDSEGLKVLSDFNPEELIPTHRQIAAVYKAFETKEISAIAFNVLRDGIVEMNSFQLLVALNALKETDLLTYRLKNGVVYGKKLPSQEKKDIQKAKMMVQLRRVLDGRSESDRTREKREEES